MSPCVRASPIANSTLSSATSKKSTDDAMPGAVTGMVGVNYEPRQLAKLVVIVTVI